MAISAGGHVGAWDLKWAPFLAEYLARGCPTFAEAVNTVEAEQDVDLGRVSDDCRRLAVRIANVERRRTTGWTSASQQTHLRSLDGPVAGHGSPSVPPPPRPGLLDSETPRKGER